MKNAIVVSVLSLTVLTFTICGCQKLSDMELSDIFVSESEIDKTLVNYALAKNGTKIYVSEEDNSNHPASTLNNGITSSKNWRKGEGWEDYFDGRFSYGQYADYGDEWQYAQREAERRAISQGRRLRNVRVNPNDFTEDDYRWRGLRSSFANYAMGWVVVELPEPKRINRVNVYTVDSSALPAEKYGVRDVAVHYWSMRAKSWQNVDRYDKKIGQKDNSISDNIAQKIVFRFQPVKTDQVRVIIRWTNDAEKEKLAYYRNRDHVTGTVRLTEIEIYGTEKKPEIDTDSELDDLLNDQDDAGGDTQAVPEVEDPELKELLDE